MTEKDYYEILGVSRAATVAEIRKAFKKAALGTHPDRLPLARGQAPTLAEAPPAGDAFRLVYEAYEVLSNAQTRRDYDASPSRQSPSEVVSIVVLELTLEELYTGTVKSVIMRQSLVQIGVPAGSDAGTRFTVTPWPDQNSVHVRIREKRHSNYTRKGNNLIYQCILESFQFWCAPNHIFTLRIPTLDSREVVMRVELNLLTHGSTYIIKNEGMPVLGRPGVKGDLFVIINFDLDMDMP